MGENLDEAEVLIKKALKLSPNKGYVIDSLGWVYYKKGRYDEAIELLNKAASLQSDDPAIMEHLGDVYVEKGDTLKALEYYVKGLSMFEHYSDEPDEKLKERLENKINRIRQNMSVESS